MTLKIIFMGTPEYSVPTLGALVDAGHKIVAVYSQPPRRSGRGMTQTKSPVHTYAHELGFRVLTPVSLRHEAQVEEFSNFKADIAIVVAYGLILPQNVLDAPRFGCVNGHASLLPRWRGAAPIQRAIEAGDTQTGVMIMQMEKGLDTGPVLMEEKIQISPTMNAGELHDELSQLTGKLMVKAVAEIEAGSLEPWEQSAAGVTYAKKIDKKETRISWNRDCNDVTNHIRAMSPFPGAWCEMELGGKLTRVKILQCEPTEKQGDSGCVLDEQLTIGCKQGSVRLLNLQKAGKKPVDAEEFLRGNPIPVGTVFY